MNYPQYAWKDGSYILWNDATVHMSSQAFGFGLSVFEGIRAYWDEQSGQQFVFRLREHLDRLHKSAKIYRLRVDVPTEELEEAVIGLLRRNNQRENVYIRVYVYPSNHWGASESISVGIFAIPRPSSLSVPSGAGIRCQTSSWRRISDASIPPRAKMAGNYLQYVLAENEAKAGNYEQAILLTNSGKVSEPPGANIILVQDDQLITPGVTSSILEGVTRSTLMELVSTEMKNIKVVERDVDRTEVYLADELLLCGTGGGEVTPVLSVDGINIADGAVGPVTNGLRNLYYDVVRGRNEIYQEWVTAVF